MHTTAHPDDEHGGVLAKLSRGDGARVALLTLNRGESGDNAIGPQLFDGLGLIRTEELLVADRYYGVDEQYFTTVVDYGFSKRLEEALDKWGRENGAARRRPHHPHEPADDHPVALPGQRARRARQPPDRRADDGREAFRAAGDPNRYPEQIAEGLRPWQPMKVYIGGVRENEDWTRAHRQRRVRPVARRFVRQLRALRPELPALAEQRPVHADRRAELRLLQLARRLGRSRQGAPDAKETIDLRRRCRRTIEAADRRGRQADRRCGGEGDGGVHDDRSVGERAGAGAGPEADARGDGGGEGSARRGSCCEIKERQFQDAINAALGIELTAVAQPAGMPEPTGPGAAFAPPALMAAPVPGQTFEVRARLANRGGVDAPSSAAITHRGRSRAGSVDAGRRHGRPDARPASAGHARASP